MVALADLRAAALALEGTVEAPHFDWTSFRVARIYATVPPHGQTANFMFSPDEQQLKCTVQPEAFSPVPNAWGVKGATTAILANLSRAELEDALRIAWLRALPKPKRRKR